MMSREVVPEPLQNIGCQDLLNLESVIHGGWLRKRHLLSNLKLFRWPRCYVILNEGCLYYFGNETSHSPAGKFSLYGYNIVHRSKEYLKEAPWAFKIIHTYPEFKTYYFSASSEKEMKEWMKHIKEVLLQANGKSTSQYYCYRDDIAATKKKDDPYIPSMSDIEEKIYDDITFLTLPHNYGKQYAVKRSDEDSDDEELHLSDGQLPGSTISSRPQLPLPRTTDTDKPDLPQSRTLEESHHLKQLPSKDSPASQRRIIMGSTHVQEDLPSNTNDDTDDYDTEDYWAAIHCPESVSPQKANDIIRHIGENGVYMVRGGTVGSVLVVFADTGPKKYRVNVENQQFSLCTKGPFFDTLEDLLYNYYTSCLPTVDVMLKKPYKLHQKYKE